MENLYFTAILSIFGSFVLVTILIPKISWIVKNRGLIDHPDVRSSHKASTPTMAGIAFFFTLIFIFILLKKWDIDSIGINLIASIGLMFAIGLKDDLVASTARAKIGGEILAIFIIIFCNFLQVSSLGGFLGVYTISPLVSYFLIVIMMLTIINAFNLIDGIDGLASSIGIVIFCVYAFIFYQIGLNFYFLLSLSLIGMLLAYMRYNLSKTKKVFMGDTGSLIIGFCIAFLSLKFLSVEAILLEKISLKSENSFFVIVAILSIPLLDTLRVIGVRLLNKKNLFQPDRSHIHHILIDSGLTHFRASLFLGLLNVVIAISLILLSSFFNSYQMVGISILYLVFFLILFYKLKANIEERNGFKYLISAIQLLF